MPELAGFVADEVLRVARLVGADTIWKWGPDFGAMHDPIYFYVAGAIRVPQGLAWRDRWPEIR